MASKQIKLNEKTFELEDFHICLKQKRKSKNG
jgi:hypothetical protein